MKTPRICFCLAGDCKTSFIGFDDFVFKRIFNGVGFARVFKLLKAVERGSKGDPRFKRIHSRHLKFKREYNVILVVNLGKSEEGDVVIHVRAENYNRGRVIFRISKNTGTETRFFFVLGGLFPEFSLK